ncbi:alpha/beta hydrolase [Kitasatospora sp. MBT63]|uniref:alpha/beta hydrolase n=1 Tax=Kitasatospora sp. MBT63 TaxID=1444768 RepID=UPI00053A31B2|nr:alpha/beta hydrolase [Kitasatospora sp. MBT63]
MRWQTAAVVAAAVVGTGTAVLLLGRKVSDRVLKPADGGGGTSLRVHGLGPGQVTLTRTTASVRPGRYALEWGDGGHAVVGDVLRTDVQTVTRRLERADGGTLTAGTEVRLTPRVYVGDPLTALGIEYVDSSVNAEIGELPAWYVPAVRGTWVVLVHGPGADRTQVLPVLPLLRSLRVPTLTVTYRGDEGAPPSPDGLGHFGETEWRDVDAAVHTALASGAGRVVLYGWSLGATIAMQTAVRSDWRGSVAGLVLDSPVLDWPATARRGAARSGAPAAVAELGALAAQGRSGVDLADFARLADGRDLQVPVLLMHSRSDEIAPWAAAERLAGRREQLVSLYGVPGAEHAALWNADPDRYLEHLRRWLTPLI